MSNKHVSTTPFIDSLTVGVKQYMDPATEAKFLRELLTTDHTCSDIAGVTLYTIPALNGKLNVKIRKTIVGFDNTPFVQRISEEVDNTPAAVKSSIEQQMSVNSVTIGKWESGYTYEAECDEPNWFIDDIISIPETNITVYDLGVLSFFTTVKWPGYSGLVNMRMVKVEDGDKDRRIITRLSDEDFDAQTMFLTPKSSSAK